MKLLIVDDSLIMRNLIEKDLKDLNFNVIGRASNGRQALEMYQKFMPELVTLDITMPEFDGIQCLSSMLKLNPKVKIMMVTALSDKATVLRALKLGAKSYIIKPFKSDKIREEFTKMLSR